jgi:PncC family amidohydrolase
MTEPAHERRLNDLLATHDDVTLATAESCSGGGVAARVTSVAGSSIYFLGGVVAYANDAKADVLGVPRTILETRGAVSPECAAAMAEGARRLFGATLAVSTTGIAGPGGGTPRKPVGLVYLALAGADGARVEERRFAGDRAAVTAAAVERALSMLVEGVEAALGVRG